MKIRKNKKCKMILLCIVCIVIAGVAVIFTMIIKYNNKPYIQAKKIIKDACNTEGLPLISIEDGNVKKYLSGQEKAYSHEGLYKLADIIFPESTGMYSMADSDSIGEFIDSIEVNINGAEQTYELFQVDKVSKDYMIAVKKPEDSEYIGITNSEYKTKDLDTLKKEIQLENSYIEILFYNENQTVVYQNIDAEYICNEFLAGNKEYIYRQGNYYSQDDLERRNINFIIRFYQKSANQRMSLSVFSDGNICIMPANGIHYEFKSDIEDTVELLNYVVSNYVGCVYVER